MHKSSEEEAGRTQIRQVQLSPSPSLFPSSSLSLFPLPICRSAGVEGSETLEPVDLGDGSI
jgi:hypothetical protein